MDDIDLREKVLKDFQLQVTKTTPLPRLVSVMPSKEEGQPRWAWIAASGMGDYSLRDVKRSDVIEMANSLVSQGEVEKSKTGFFEGSQVQYYEPVS